MGEVKILLKWAILTLLEKYERKINNLHKLNQFLKITMISMYVNPGIGKHYIRLVFVKKVDRIRRVLIEDN